MRLPQSVTKSTELHKRDGVMAVMINVRIAFILQKQSVPPGATGATGATSATRAKVHVTRRRLSPSIRYNRQLHAHVLIRKL